MASGNRINLSISKKWNVIDLYLIDRLPAYNEPLVFPDRNEWTHRAYPIWFCLTCKQKTDYSQTCCERCAIGYTKAFYKLSEEYLGIKVVDK